MHFKIYLAVLGLKWNMGSSSLTWDQTWALCIWNTES